MPANHVAIISARRPKNVPKMHAYTGDGVTWYVAQGDTGAYRAAGAVNIVEAGDLIAARNAALVAAFDAGVNCVQLSDDLGGICIVNEDKSTDDITLDEAIGFLQKATEVMGVRLAGVAPVANTFYIDPAKPIRDRHFILGDFMLIAPSEPRFDEQLRLKEDYDFTAQHIQRYGGVARCDVVMAKFAHRSNSGGAVSYRTPELEQAAIDRLTSKWGDAIVPNPRRPNEILFRGNKVKTELAR